MKAVTAGASGLLEDYLPAGHPEGTEIHELVRPGTNLDANDDVHLYEGNLTEPREVESSLLSLRAEAILNLAASRNSALCSVQQIKLVYGVCSQLLYAGKSAQAVWEGVQELVSGTVNVGGGGRLSPHESAQLVAQVFDLNESFINSFSISVFPALARPPAETNLDLCRLRAKLELKVHSPADRVQVLKESEPKLNVAS